MASVVDLGLIQGFSDVFALILIFLVVYAALTVTKIFNINPGINALIAAMVALISAVNPKALQIVSGISPLFVVFIIFLMFLLVAAMFAGFTKGDIITALGGQTGAAFWIILTSIILLGIVISNVFGQQLLEQFSGGGSSENTDSTPVDTNGDGIPDTTTGGNNFQSNFGKTLFHPKILGLILILVIASFSVRMLTSAPLGR